MFETVDEKFAVAAVMAPVALRVRFNVIVAVSNGAHEENGWSRRGHHGCVSPLRRR